MKKYIKTSLLLIGMVLILAMGSVSATDVGNNTTNMTNVTNVTNVTNSTGLADSASPVYQVDNQHTGQSDYEGPQTNTTQWMNNITAGGSSVVAPDGTIYVGGGSDGILYAFRSDGSRKWAYQTASYLFGSPAIGADGTVYVSCWRNSTLYAFSPNGDLKWTYNFGDYNFGSSPAIDLDGTIYIPVSNGTFYALNSDGTLKWTYNMGEVYGSSPAIGPDGTIYIEDYDGFMHALNSDGTQKWSVNLAQFVGKSSVNVYYSSPSVGSDGTIYIGVQAGFIVALNADGTRKWVYIANKGTVESGNLGESLYGSPSISNDGTVYVVGSNNVYAVQHRFASVGSLQWTFDIGSVDVGTLSVAIGSDGTIYVGSKTGVYAINPDGTLKWSYNTSSVTGSPMIGANGNLYVGTDGIFYAFNDNAPSFISEHVQGTALTIQFTDKTTGNLKSWKWDFGDNSTSTTRNPAHTYSKAGTYKVTLTVTLQNGSKLTGNKIITVEEKDIIAPTATISPNGGVFDTIQTVTINATDNSGKATVYYTVDGSDPRTSDTRIVYTHPFEIGGTVTLKFAAVDGDDNWSPVYTELFTILGVIYVQEASYYSNGTMSLSDQIQSILDDAKPGSIITFLGQTYRNLHLTINKKLSIISNGGTTISGSSTVFLINGSQASGTRISGFTIITDADSGILVNNTDKVTIFGVTISSTNGTAITVNGSSNTTIKYGNIHDSFTGVKIYNSSNTQITESTIKGNKEEGIDVENSTNTTLIQNHILDNTKRGVKIYNSTNVTVDSSTIEGNGENAGVNSDDGGVYVQSSDQITITNNQITGNTQGISTRDVSNVTIEDNAVIDNSGEGILLSGYAKNLTIKSNYLQKNANGIKINYGAGENVTITGNTITDNLEKLPQNVEDNGDGISFGSEYRLITGESIKHNVILDNGHFDVRASEARYATPSMGSNWYGNSPKLCPAITYAPFMYIRLTRTGTNTYTVEFIDGVTNETATDMPPRSVTFTAGYDSQTVLTKDGKASVTFSLTNLVGFVEAMVDGVKSLIPWYTEVTGGIDNKGDFSRIVGLIRDDTGDGDGGDNGDGGDDGDGDDSGDNGDGGDDGDDNENPTPEEPEPENPTPEEPEPEDPTPEEPEPEPENPTPENEGDYEDNSDDGNENARDSFISGISSVAGLTSLTAAVRSASAGQVGFDDSPVGSNGQTSPQSNSKTAQELFVDEMQNPQIWGIIGIILLLVLIFGAYYRTDLMNMIKKSKK